MFSPIFSSVYWWNALEYILRFIPESLLKPDILFAISISLAIDLSTVYIHQKVIQFLQILIPLAILDEYPLFLVYCYSSIYSKTYCNLKKK